MTDLSFSSAAGGDLPGEPPTKLDELVAVMARLRAPGGCPWDADQTHESLVQYLIEETYELIEAIETGDRDEMLEELGDVLYQVLFHADIAAHTPGRGLRHPGCGRAHDREDGRPAPARLRRPHGARRRTTWSASGTT